MLYVCSHRLVFICWKQLVASKFHSKMQGNISICLKNRKWDRIIKWHKWEHWQTVLWLKLFSAIAISERSMCGNICLFIHVIGWNFHFLCHDYTRSSNLISWWLVRRWYFAKVCVRNSENSIVNIWKNISASDTRTWTCFWNTTWTCNQST